MGGENSFDWLRSTFFSLLDASLFVFEAIFRETDANNVTRVWVDDVDDAGETQAQYSQLPSG